jgi:hypothetical protein
MGANSVYILTNRAMPGLVKIGMTTKSVHERIRDLSSTGVPEPFKLYYACEIRDDLNPAAVEHDMHLLFAPYRHNQKREFFAVDPARVKIALRYAEKPKATPVVPPKTKPTTPEFMPPQITKSLFQQLIDSARGFRRRQHSKNYARPEWNQIPDERIEEIISADWAGLMISVNDTGTYFQSIDYALREFYMWANDKDQTWECECPCCRSRRSHEAYISTNVSNLERPKHESGDSPWQ